MLAKLCDKKFLPEGELRSFKLGEREILAINAGGKIYCLDGRCTHAGAPLAEGTLEGQVLTCPWHYSQFNISDGSVLRGPAYKPLKPYAVEERDGFIFIDL
ncbi:MAG: Rieske 2Fe-2S domain-containing protein [Candidatus Bathyarchaeota archaeon]|nr:Rieske 2Fe-2S domain-containing protein [Candidatus Bathyarchaeota archaeon]